MLLLMVFLCLKAKTQINADSAFISYADPIRYEIGRISVAGNEFSDEAAIIAISGLTIGQQIVIPGAEINNAMKKIWNLKLFRDIEIKKAKVISDVVFLEIKVQEHPRLSAFTLKGLKKTDVEKLSELIKPHLPEGRILTTYNKQNAIEAIRLYYEEKGYPNAVIQTNTREDNRFENAIILQFDIDKRNKVKVMQIEIEGNKNISDRKLKKLMTFTNEKRKLFKKSLLTETGFAADKKRILEFYRTKGFQDAKIISEDIRHSEEGDWIIKIKIKEGPVYRIRNIKWDGNTVYSNETLSAILGMSKGDIYNTQLLAERLQFSPEGRDISGLYMDNGYLFFNINFEELGIDKDSVDLKINIQEGPVAIIGRVSISGNDVTTEEIILREIRTRPGDRFSRAAIIRSQRALVNLGFFKPETLDIKTNVHPETGTVDIEYIVEEKSNDQFELAASWDPASNRLVGTLGLSFNNISLKNFFKKSAWNPIPRGDGQHLSFRIQSTGREFQSYNVSFTEPWLGGKKPSNLTVAGFFTNRFFETSEGTDQRFKIFGASANMSTRLQWPDDNFISSTSINYNRIILNDWLVDGFELEDGTPLSDGTFNNFYIKQTIARNTINHPIFPSSGSNVSLSLQFTPPYSLFSDKGNDKSPQEKFKWLEYYKLRFDGQWYTPLGKKLVLKSSAKMGMISAYNQQVGLSPFERFWFGGNGFDAQQGFTGIDLISMRGYNATSDFPVNQNGGATAFGKFSLELRYPIVQSPASTIYLTAFAEAGNAWGNLKSVKPFNLKRSAGLGIRAHLPMFGLIGFDYGIGFDKEAIGTGSYLSRYGRFSLILGFEPD